MRALTLLLTPCLIGTAWAEVDRYVAVGVQIGAIEPVGPPAATADRSDVAYGVGFDMGWRTDYGWLMLGARTEDEGYGGDVGWQIHPMWGVAPVIGLRLGARRLRRGWSEDLSAGDTTRTSAVGGLDLGVRYTGDPGWLIQVLARPSLNLLVNQTTEQDSGMVRQVAGVTAPEAFTFAELAFAVQIGRTW